ncbi:MAG TPA: hypothetical protein ENJ19_05255 [Gammaproteobacteria bacterium]|nr:hypothetical protein [Gammaproteobacteria bacterium]
MDYVVVSGDTIQITFPGLIIPPIAAPLPLVGTGIHKASGQIVCVVGDEYPVAIRSMVPYTKGSFVTPGSGKIWLTLAPQHQTQKTKCGGKPLLLKGGTLQAKFIAMTPAMQPSPAGPVPDPVPVVSGTAQFITRNTKVRAA